MPRVRIQLNKRQLDVLEMVFALVYKRAEVVKRDKDSCKAKRGQTERRAEVDMVERENICTDDLEGL